MSYEHHYAVYAFYRLRIANSDFSGFDFNDSSNTFREKLEYITAFSISDLTYMCNILGLDYTKEELQESYKFTSIKTLSHEKKR